jgi:hypothetical protein
MGVAAIVLNIIFFDTVVVEAPMQEEPITECGSRPSGFSAFSSE